MRTERAPQPARSRAGLAVALAAGLVASMAAPSARADGDDNLSPYLLGVYQGIATDSNLFRAPDGGNVQRDTISSTGVRAGLDLPISRQRLRANLGANYNRFNKNSQLNNTDYNLGARLDWETIERISGVVSVEQQRSLYRDSINGVVSTDRNLLRTSSAGAQVRVGVVTLWSFEGGLAVNANDYSSPALVNRNLRQEAVNAGVRYRPSDALSVKLGVRHTEGRYPNIDPETDHFKRNDIDLTGSFDLTGVSKLNARVSSTHEKHTVDGGRDLNGWTGGLQWLWKPTGKLTFDSNLTHDTSVGRANFESPLISSDTGDSREANAAILKATWATTAKIQVVGNASYIRRKLDNAFISGGGNGTITTNDRTSVFGLGVRWQPLRPLEFACNVGKEHRSVEGSNALSVPYSADTANCSAQLSLQ
jgi:hypothetical protein